MVKMMVFCSTTKVIKMSFSWYPRDVLRQSVKTGSTENNNEKLAFQYAGHYVIKVRQQSSESHFQQKTEHWLDPSCCVLLHRTQRTSEMTEKGDHNCQLVDLEEGQIHLREHIGKGCRAAAIFGGGRASRQRPRADEPCKPTLRVG